MLQELAIMNLQMKCSESSHQDTITELSISMISFQALAQKVMKKMAISIQAMKFTMITGKIQISTTFALTQKMNQRIHTVLSHSKDHFSVLANIHTAHSLEKTLDICAIRDNLRILCFRAHLKVSKMTNSIETYSK